MKKLYVIVSKIGRTEQQVADIREQIRQDVEEGLMEDISLSLPPESIEGVAGDVYAITQSDIVVSTQGSMYDRDCRVCNLAASEYMQYGVYEEDWVEGIVAERRKVREQENQESLASELEDEEVPDESVPA